MQYIYFIQKKVTNGALEDGSISRELPMQTWNLRAVPQNCKKRGVLARVCVLSDAGGSDWV